MSAPPVAGAAREQVLRLLTLVPLLHARGQVRLGEAGELLGVTPDQVLADLKVLFMCGLPGGMPDDLIDVDVDALERDDGAVLHDGLIRIENADYLARPLRLTPTEASAVMVALRALRDGSPEATAEIVDRVLTKLEAAAESTAGASPASGAQRVELGEVAEPAAPSESLAVVAALQEAIAEQRQLRLRYFVPTRDEVTERVVDPWRLQEAEGHRYLEAWCHSAEAERLFRLDRIQAAEALDTAVVAPPAEPRDLSRGLFEQSSSGTVATLRLAATQRWVVEYYPVLDSRPLPDGRIEVDLVVADPAWLERLVLRLAPDAEVLAPAPLADGVRAVADRALGLYA